MSASSLHGLRPTTARKVISQREARALQARVKLLEGLIHDQRYAWAREWPGGVHLNTITWNGPQTITREVLTARKLGHAVVATVENDQLRLYALPLAKVPA